jgi:HlyD family secretion protein
MNSDSRAKKTSVGIACLVAACSSLPALEGCAPPPVTAGHRLAENGEPIARLATWQGRMVLTGELQAVRAEKIHVPRTPTWRMPIRWLAEDGAVVTRGEKVLELDNAQFTGELAQKQLAESRAGNDLARKRADVAVSLGEKGFAVEEKRILLEKARIQAAIPADVRSLREHQEDQLALARAESELDKAEEDLAAALEASEAELDELQIALDRTREEVATAEQAIQALTLSAPRDGILVVAENEREGRKYQVGDNVWVGLAVMRIPDLTAMKVEARLSDVDDGRIAPGMLATCTLDIYPERRFTGRVTEIAPVAQEDDDQSLRRSFRAMILLDESDPLAMRPGMSVRAEVLEPAIENSILVPRATLDWSGDAPRVLLADGSSVEVVLGPCSAQECVVAEGLSEGVRLRNREPLGGSG